MNHVDHELENLLSAVSEPMDYYKGLRRRHENPPDNILAFVRRSRDLGQENTAAIHQRWVLIIALRGSGVLQLEGTEVRISAGEAIMIPPLHLHGYREVNGRLCWVFITFDWGGHSALSEEWAGQRQLNRETRATMKTFLREWLSCRTEAGGSIVAARLLCLLRQLFPAVEMRSTPPTSLVALVQDAVRKVAPGGTSSVAAEVGMSASHLRALFRKETGLSLGRFIRESRLREASLGLQNGELSIKVAAERAGYADAFAFSRAFTRTLGQPPSTFTPG